MTISVILADDNLLVREGVRALMELAEDLEVVGVADDFDGLIDGATQTQPQVVVTDIRMPPDFQREGIEAAKLVRKRLPGTGIVILSQYDDSHRRMFGTDLAGGLDALIGPSGGHAYIGDHHVRRRLRYHRQ